MKLAILPVSKHCKADIPYRVKIEKTTNNLYLSGANPGYEVRGEACDTFGQKKQQKRILRGGCMHATPPPDSFQLAY
jgi:hypothetical protein